MSEPHPPELRYSMVIEWSDEDNAFIFTVPELRFHPHIMI